MGILIFLPYGIFTVSELLFMIVGSMSHVE